MSPGGLITLPDTHSDSNPGMDILKMGTVVIEDMSPDRDPNLRPCNVHMFCILQCSYRVCNLSPCPAM